MISKQICCFSCHAYVCCLRPCPSFLSWALLNKVVCMICSGGITFSASFSFAQAAVSP